VNPVAMRSGCAAGAQALQAQTHASGPPPRTRTEDTPGASAWHGTAPGNPAGFATQSLTASRSTRILCEPCSQHGRCISGQCASRMGCLLVIRA
jgi:hypothetical protein